MDARPHAALSNALAAGLLAVVAAAAGCFCRRPAVRHTLWLLALLKLLTPPLVNVPIPWPVQSDSALAELAVALPPPPVVAREQPLPDNPSVVLSDGPDPEIAETPPVAEEPAVNLEVPSLLTEPAPSEAWHFVLYTCWLAGSLSCLALTLVRVRRFSRLLRHGQAPSADLRAEVDRLAGLLRLKSAPALLLVPGRLSPMVWGLLSPRLLLPVGLLEKVDDRQRQALLVHELAHLRRRDHWVRVLELLVTALYWWHPVVWWSRRELREAEEQCCDAWVLWVLPGSGRSYALALVETMDYLAGTRAPLPVLASGARPGADLRRRLTMIMQGTIPRGLSWCGVLILAALGALLLPVVPGWAEQPPQAKPESGGVDDNIIKKTEVEIIRHKAELERARRELRQAEAMVKMLEAQSKQMEMQLKKAVDAKMVAEARKAQLDQEQEKTRAATEIGKSQPLRIVIKEGDKVRMIELPAGSRFIDDAVLHLKKEDGRMDALQWSVKPVEGSLERLGVLVRPLPDMERRLAEMEKKLAGLQGEVDSLKGALRRNPPPPLPGAPGQPNRRLPSGNPRPPAPGVPGYGPDPFLAPGTPSPAPQSGTPPGAVPSVPGPPPVVPPPPSPVPQP